MRPSAATRNSVGRSQSAIAAHIAPTTVSAVTVSEKMSPSFTQMFGLIAAIPAAISPTASPPIRRPRRPIRNTSNVPNTTIV